MVSAAISNTCNLQSIMKIITKKQRLISDKSSGMHGQGSCHLASWNDNNI